MSGRPGAPVRLFMVDDHPAVREGLRLLLEQSGVVVCGEAGDVAGALAAIPTAATDLVMVDLSLGKDSGLTLLRWLAARFPLMPLLVYLMHEDFFHLEKLGLPGMEALRRRAALDRLPG